jgi:hypothetical protein
VIFLDALNFWTTADRWWHTSGIRVYARRMSEVMPGRPKRKSMFLGERALRDLAATAARRRTERDAVEEALALLAARDAQRDAMAEFVDWALAEWGEPTEAERARAEEIWSNR